VKLLRNNNIGKEYKINPMIRQRKNLSANDPGIMESLAVLIGNYLLKKNPGIRFFLTKSPRDDMIIELSPNTLERINSPRSFYWTTQ
jgi:hypothetical protein